MIAGLPISDLAESLKRMRSGEQTSGEIVRWLRAVHSIAQSVPVPQNRSATREYTRTLLHKSDAFEVLVLHWKPGSASLIHDHGGAQCWFTVVGGTMLMENYVRYDMGNTPKYARVGMQGREQLLAGSVDYRSDDVNLHRCIAGDGAVTTLHVYARPIERFYTFDEDANSCMQAVATYDAVL
jgi:cysteine dioxygenase